MEFPEFELLELYHFFMWNYLVFHVRLDRPIVFNQCSHDRDAGATIENFVFGDLNAWTCAFYKERWNYSNRPQPTTLPFFPETWNVAQCCYSRVGRMFELEKSFNSWPFLCKEADRPATRRVRTKGTSFRSTLFTLSGDVRFTIDEMNTWIQCWNAGSFNWILVFVGTSFSCSSFSYFFQVSPFLFSNISNTFWNLIFEIFYREIRRSNEIILIKKYLTI